MRYHTQDIFIPSEKVLLPASLSLPENPKGLVLFVHGSGSSRLSPRNIYVADVLLSEGVGSLLFDLLTPEEALQNHRDHGFRFAISFLTQRLLHVTQWVTSQESLRPYGIGYFGASTGAAAALDAAALLPSYCQALVLRGGRPDLALSDLDRVRVPTLFIVGGEDHEVLRWNEKAYRAILHAPAKKLSVIAGAGHLFEEAGALQEVAGQAAGWFKTHLQSPTHYSKKLQIDENHNGRGGYCDSFPC